MIPRCPTCGSVVEVVTADEGTSSYRPVDASSTRPHQLPDAAVVAAGQKLKRHMIGDDLECVPRGATLDVADGWVRAIDMAAEEAMPVVLAAALPHLLTDAMVERAARALWAEGHPYLEWGLADKWAQRQTRADARVALEAALGGAA